MCSFAKYFSGFLGTSKTFTRTTIEVTIRLSLFLKMTIKPDISHSTRNETIKISTQKLHNETHFHVFLKVLFKSQGEFTVNFKTPS